jgi:RNA polymerase sigma-70 factor (ECF subfamily)
LDKSDAALIEETLMGNLRAFDSLMERYERLVYKVALSYGGERQNALDITQNVFLKAYENLASLRSDAKFKSWIVRITYHESVNWLRRNRRASREEEFEENFNLAGDVRNQERTLLEKESATILLQCMGRLNPKHRMVVGLRYFEGLPIAEIASVMRCSEGLVKNILFRSIQKMRKHMTAMR